MYLGGFKSECVAKAHASKYLYILYGVNYHHLVLFCCRQGMGIEPTYF